MKKIDIDMSKIKSFEQFKENWDNQWNNNEDISDEKKQEVYDKIKELRKMKNESDNNNNS